MIVRTAQNRWEVRGRKGQSLGSYPTKAKAQKRLKQIEFFKNNPEDDGDRSAPLKKRYKRPSPRRGLYSPD